MKISINNYVFNTKVMVSPKDIQMGMMGKKFNKDFTGMLFMMDEGEHCFWMKDCIVPLDIIYIDKNKVTSIHHSCPPCKTNECENYCGNGDLVLELPSGACKKIGVSVGDVVKIKKDLN